MFVLFQSLHQKKLHHKLIVSGTIIAFLQFRLELCHHVRVLITLVMETFKRHILNIYFVNRSVNEVSARKKLEHSVGLEVVVGVITVLSGSDIVLSGRTQGDDLKQH